MNTDLVTDWKPSDMLEIVLSQPDDFLKVKETLTRVGVAAEGNRLFQSVHVLHKRGRYYLTHFKELMALDGCETSLSREDLQRRNTIATLLSDWGLVTIVRPELYTDRAPMKLIKVIPFREKQNWQLIPKYEIGVPKRRPNKG